MTFQRCGVQRLAQVAGAELLFTSLDEQTEHARLSVRSDATDAQLDDVLVQQGWTRVSRWAEVRGRRMSLVSASDVGGP